MLPAAFKFKGHGHGLVDVKAESMPGSSLEITESGFGLEETHIDAGEYYKFILSHQETNLPVGKVTQESAQRKECLGVRRVNWRKHR